jgi:hypothetical protein
MSHELLGIAIARKLPIEVRLLVSLAKSFSLKGYEPSRV